MIGQLKGSVLKKTGLFALNQIARSNATHQHLAVFPISVVAGILKAVVNFLLLYRIATGNRYMDSVISFLVCAFTAFISPVFYAVAQQRERDLVKFTTHFMDRVMAKDGVVFLLSIRNRGIMLTGLIMVMVLSVVQVDSPYLIQCILEYLFSFWIVDKVNQYRDSLYVPQLIEWKQEFHPRVVPQKLTRNDFFKITTVHTVTIANTKTDTAEWVHIYPAPKRAILVKIPTATILSIPPQQVAGSFLRIVENYGGDE